VSTPQTKLNWDDLRPTDARSAEATALATEQEATRQRLNAALTAHDRVLQKAANAGYGVKLNWNELEPADNTRFAPHGPDKSGQGQRIAGLLKDLTGKPKSITKTAEPSIDQIASQFEVLKRSGNLAETKPLLDKLRAAGWEVGADYIKPPAELPGAYPLWEYQLAKQDAPIAERSPLTMAISGPVMPVARYVAETAEPIVGMGKGLLKIGKAALTGKATEAVKESYNLMLKPQVDQLTQAYNLWEQRGGGDNIDPEIAAHAVAGVIPFLGPMAAQAGEQLGAGEYRKFSQSVILLALPALFKAIKAGVPVEEAAKSTAEQIRPLIGKGLVEPIAADTERLATGAKPKVLAQHHSNFQPRTEAGQFDGPPTPEYAAARGLPQAEEGAGAPAARPSISEPTGIANAVTEAERAARGLDPIDKELVRSFPESHAAGIQIVDTDPVAFRTKVAELAQNPRPLSDIEDAALAYDRKRLQNEHKALMDQYETTSDPTTKAEIRTNLEHNEAQTAINDEAAVRTGTANGRGLNARKMMIAEDYSLSSLVQKARVASGKTEIPETVRIKLNDLSKQIADLQARLDKAETAKPKTAASKATAANVLAKLETAADEARTRIAARKAAGERGAIGERPVGEEGLPGGVDALADYVTIGAAHLARIGADFATWSAEMVREFGDTIKPYLQQVYAAAKDQVTAAQSGRLATYKKGLAKRVATAEQQLVTEDFTKPQRMPLILDKEAVEMQVKLADLHRQADKVIARQAWDQKTGLQKTLGYVAAGSRASVLSGAGTVGKIASAVGQSYPATVAGEIAGTGLRRIFPETFAAAPRHGAGFSLEAEAAAAKGFIEGVKRIPGLLRTGETPQTLLHGKAYPTIPTTVGTILSIPGRLHAALKNPLKVAEIYRSTIQRLNWAERNGYDIADPAVRLAIDHAALSDGDEVVLMGNSELKKAISRIDQNWSDEAKSIGRTLVPVRGVPANYLTQMIGEYMFGTVRGAIRILKSRNPEVWAKLNTPAQADLTARLLKRGTVGVVGELAALALGKKVLGGYYQPGEKPKEGEPKPGELQIGKAEISHRYLHSPLMEDAQAVATFRREVERAQQLHEGTGRGLATGFGSTFIGVGQQVPFLGRYMQTIEDMKSGKGTENVLGQIVASIVEPQLMQEVARATDKATETRKPQGFKETLKLGVPGLRKQVPTATEAKGIQRMNAYRRRILERTQGVQP
jgi:hypothetical protein